MKDFGTIDYTTGAFPDTVADDSSGPTVRDGMPLTAQWPNELFGFFQAAMEFAGMSPDGNAEDASTMPASSDSSQVLIALRRALSMPGEVIYFAGRDPDPATHNGRLIELAGQGVLIADYPDLVGVTYCGDADNATASSFFKVDNPAIAPPVRNTAGLYMMLPNCRGQFIRALNGAAAFPVDVDRNLNSLNDEPGSEQLAQAGDHDHPVGWLNGAVPSVLNNDNFWLYSVDPSLANCVETDILTRSGTAITNGTTEGFGITSAGGYDPAVPTDTETRPKNVAFYAMIRY